MNYVNEIVEMNEPTHIVQGWKRYARSDIPTAADGLWCVKGGEAVHFLKLGPGGVIDLVRKP